MSLESAKRSIQLPNIIAGCIALGVVVAMGFHLTQHIEPIKGGANSPWIGLPKSGMDASEYPTRATILHAAATDGWPDDSHASLASQCGSPYEMQDSKLVERYVARIGADAWSPFWKITLDVNGDRVDVSLSYDSPVPPPPPPPPAIHPQESSPTLIVPVAHIEKSRADLERIRMLWSDEALWHAPQDGAYFSCLDGNPVFLEACIDGRYAARARNCNASAFEATDKLWHAFKALLPPPPKPEWRDAEGNVLEQQ